MRMKRLREEREEDEELIRVMNAFEHAEIVQMETEEERAYREEISASPQPTGSPTLQKGRQSLGLLPTGSPTSH